jgi:hypothetical protein
MSTERKQAEFLLYFYALSDRFSVNKAVSLKTQRYSELKTGSMSLAFYSINIRSQNSRIAVTKYYSEIQMSM